MDNKFDEELRKKYLKEFKVDISTLTIKELIKKGKDKSIDNNAIFIRAALEKQKKSLEDRYNPRYLRRAQMKYLLDYYNNDESKDINVVLRGYLLHVEEGVELPSAFEERIQAELLKIAKRKLGKENKSFFDFQKKKEDIYQDDIVRVNLLIEVIDVSIKDGLALDKAYASVACKYQGKYPWVNYELLKSLYNNFRRHGTIRGKK